LKARDDNDRVQIEVLDGGGNERQVSSVAPLSAGQWYHAAAVSDGATMSLYLDRNDGLGYVLQGATPVTGALIDSAATCTVGRGFYNGGITDWTDGKIDEVRITDAAIDPTQFLFFDPAGPPVWNVNAGGSFSAQANWSRATPNSINAVAYFTDAIRSPRTIDVDASRTVAGLVFNNTNSYTLAGPGTITIDTNGALGVISSLAGAHTIAAPVALKKSTTIAVAEQFTMASDLAAAPGVNDIAITKSGAGELKLKNIRAKSLNIAAGKVAMLPDSSAAGASALDTLTLSAGSRFDLSANKLVLRAMPVGSADGSGNYDGVQGLVQRAYNFGAWDQPGLTTSQETAGQTAGPLSGTTTIGVATAEQVLFIGPTETATFMGQTVTGASVIAMYTYAGDVNFDGLVDGADYGTLDNWIQFPGTSGYANGDVNYDGIIDGADYGVLDNTIQLQGPPIPVNEPAGAVAAVAVVPEPVAGGFALLAAAASLSRRRRQKTKGFR